MSRIERLGEALRVKPGTRVDLSRMDAAATHGWQRPAAEEATADQIERLTDAGPPVGGGEALGPRGPARASMQPARTGRSAK